MVDIIKLVAAFLGLFIALYLPIFGAAWLVGIFKSYASGEVDEGRSE